MKKSKFSEVQIHKILQQHESGVPLENILHEHGISKATLYNWKGRYGGMELSEMKRVKELEEENSRLKRMFADLSLQHEALKGVLSKKF
jgi:putative transposase